MRHESAQPLEEYVPRNMCWKLFSLSAFLTAGLVLFEPLIGDWVRSFTRPRPMSGC